MKNTVKLTLKMLIMCFMFTKQKFLSVFAPVTFFRGLKQEKTKKKKLEMNMSNISPVVHRYY